MDEKPGNTVGHCAGVTNVCVSDTSVRPNNTWSGSDECTHHTISRISAQGNDFRSQGQMFRHPCKALSCLALWSCLIGTTSRGMAIFRWRMTHDALTQYKGQLLRPQMVITTVHEWAHDLHSRNPRNEIMAKGDYHVYVRHQSTYHCQHTIHGNW